MQCIILYNKIDKNDTICRSIIRRRGGNVCHSPFKRIVLPDRYMIHVYISCGDYLFCGQYCGLIFELVVL